MLFNANKQLLYFSFTKHITRWILYGKIYPSIYLSIYLSVYLSIYLSIIYLKLIDLVEFT